MVVLKIVPQENVAHGRSKRNWMLLLRSRPLKINDRTAQQFDDAAKTRPVDQQTLTIFRSCFAFCAFYRYEI